MYNYMYVYKYVVLIPYFSHVHLNAAASDWWWIKADGVDVVKGLGKSLRLQLSGDVDLCVGELQKQYQLYRKRLVFIQALATTSSHLLDDLENVY